jgi:hypothetical protein
MGLVEEDLNTHLGCEYTRVFDICRALLAEAGETTNGYDTLSLFSQVPVLSLTLSRVIEYRLTCLDY